MKNFFRILIVSTFLISTPTNPVITFLSKHMTPQGKTIYVVGDHHYAHKGDKVGKTQAATLLQFAHALPQAFVIAEDILAYKGTNQEVKQVLAFMKTQEAPPLLGLNMHITFGKQDLGWQQAWAGSPLIGFVEQCIQAAVSSSSIEFRQTRDASASEGTKITCSEVITSLDTIMKEIEQYNDGEQLTRYYDFAINNYLNESQRKLLQKKDCADQSIHEAFSSRRKELAKILCFGINLMVPRLLHAIHTDKDKHNLIIFIGDEHAKNLTEVLSKLGYKNKEVLYKEPRTDKDNDIAYMQISALDLDTYFEQELKQLKAVAQESSAETATTTASSSSSSSSVANSASTTTVELQKS